MLSGFATPEGTARLRSRFPSLANSGHYRTAGHAGEASSLSCSSIGLGTYLGTADAATDARYSEAAGVALEMGVNVLDTAINYRHQRSERNIGSALQRAVSTGKAQRDEVLVCTKAGYIAFDGDQPPDPRGYFAREYFDRGVMKPEDLAAGMHCMAPSYLANQIERSRYNLNVETLDVFYLHNPETQLSDGTRERFFERIGAAFDFLESMVAEKHIRFYGAATWNGFRVAPTARDYLGLESLVEIAREAGGAQHHFRFVQLPFNLGMLEAAMYQNQNVGGAAYPLLGAAEKLGVAVVGSASMLQGQLAGNLPDFIAQTLGFAHGFENSIQFARSAPGLLTALVGMSRREHVIANCRIAERPLTDPAVWRALLQRAG